MAYHNYLFIYFSFAALKIEAHFYVYDARLPTNFDACSSLGRKAAKWRVAAK